MIPAVCLGRLLIAGVSLFVASLAAEPAHAQQKARVDLDGIAGEGRRGGPADGPGGTSAGTVDGSRVGTVEAFDSVPELQETLVDLRIGRVARETVRALTDGTDAYIPVADLLRIGEVEHVLEGRGTLRAVLHPGARLVVVEPGATEALVAGSRVQVDPASVAIDRGSLFVATPLLERLFGITIRTDWSQLTVVVMDPETLPIGRRLAREARWRILKGESSVDGRARAPLNQGSIGGAVLDWSVASGTGDPAGSTSYAVGAGARVFGGGLQMSARSLGAVGLGEHQVDITYEQVRRDRRWLRQMRLGDGFATGPRIRSVRGLALTNAPYLRDAYFGTDGFTGRVGPGWDVELRQSGRTVDLTRADEGGAFALDIPLRYGENAVQVVAFGPHGEVVTTERLFLLGTDRLPAGEIEWGLSGGACRDDRCSLTGNLDLRYGLSNRWTLRAGTEAFARDTLASLVQPYVGVSGMVVPGLEMSFEGVRAGFLRAGATFAPSSRIRIRGYHTAFDTGVETPVLHDARRRGTTEADLLVRPVASTPRWLVRGAVLRQELQSGTLSLAQASSTFDVAGVGIEVGVRHERDDPVLGARSSRDFQVASVTGLLPLPGRRNLWLRGETEWLDAASVERVRGRLGYQVSPAARLEIASGWSRSVGADFAIGLSAYLGGLRGVTQVSGQRGAPARVTQVAQGTVHWDDAIGGVRFAPGPGVERGGISGYVFVDENGNGARDPFERGLDGVRVVVGGRTVRTDAEGRHHAWDLVPYEPVRVWADSSSILDPTLVPVEGAVEVLVPPASFGRVDIAVTPSVEFSGRVVRVGPHGEVPVPHAQLELRDLRTGEIRSVRTYSDGEFYEAGVKPGRYELRVEPGSLSALGLVPEQDSYLVEALPGERPSPTVVRLLAADVALTGGRR